MARSIPGCAVEIVVAYYERLSPIARGLEERKDPQGPTQSVAPEAPGLSGGASDSTFKWLMVERRLNDLRIADEFKDGWYSDAEIVLHAQRILVTWAKEYRCLSGEQRYLPDLIAFDPEYLYLGRIVNQLMELRVGGRIPLSERRRKERSTASDQLRSILLHRAEGRPARISREELADEFERILEELRRPTPQRSLQGLKFDPQPWGVDVALIPERRSKDLPLMKRFVLRVSDSDRELRGFNKAVVMTFAHAPWKVDRRGSVKLMEPSDDPLLVDSPRNWWGLLGWDPEPDDVDGLREHWADLRRAHKRRKHRELASALLALKYDYKITGTAPFIRSASVLSKVKPSGYRSKQTSSSDMPSIVEADPWRRWKDAERWIAPLPERPPRGRVPLDHPRAMLSQTRQAHACGLPPGELDTVAFANPSDFSDEPEWVRSL